MNRQHVKSILASSRLPFLILTPVSIFLAVISIHYSSGIYDFWITFWILLGAFSAHISVNLFNEYFDFRSGLDFLTKRTAFSGGSGALPENPDSSKYVLIVSIFTFILTCLSGLYLIYLSYIRFDQFNVSLFIIGILGLALILLYTGPINRAPWICLFSPGMGFGFFMVYGSSSILLGTLSLTLLPSALLVFFMVNNLLLLNQLPDVDADREIGRQNIWLTKGNQFAFNAYLSTTLIIPTLFLFSIWCNIWPALSLLALIPWCLTLYAWRGAKRVGNDIAQYPQFLAMNVLATLGVPFILSLTLLFKA